MKVTFVAVLSLLWCVVIGTVEAQGARWHQLDGYTFERYQRDFDKVYGDGKEKRMREALFYAKLREVRRFNEEGKATYRKGINQFSDRTAEELAGMRGAIVSRSSAAPHGSAGRRRGKRAAAVGSAALPTSVDYRNALPPILTAVKDQGHCGSCWAHAATEQLETYNALERGELNTLSQQQLVSCVKNRRHCGGTGGCFGGTAQLSFEYMEKHGGLSQEWEYGYQSYFGETPSCAFNASKMKTYGKVLGYVQLPRNSYSAVVRALVTTGPLSVSVDASEWFDYESGVFSGCSYAKNITMDHAVQLVGYGTDGLQEYWVIRNSWSPQWGEKGFLRLARHAVPSCGWNNDWQEGGGCRDDPSTIWACGECGVLYDATFPVVDTNGAVV